MKSILKLNREDVSATYQENVIIVPCYNEAERLPVSDFLEFIEKDLTVRFLFVNDGSHDKTVSVLADLISENSDRFSLLDLKQNRGKAEAIRQGALLLLDDPEVRMIGFWDADLSTPLSEIPRFCDLLTERVELAAVIGSRLPLLGRSIDRKPLRRFLGNIFATAASFALGTRLVDTQCGAKLFRVTPALRQVFAEPFQSKWIFDVEIFSRYHQLMQRTPETSLKTMIYEQPLEAWIEVGSSRLKRSDFVKAFFELSQIYWKATFHPLQWDDAVEPSVIPLPIQNSQTDQQNTEDLKAA